jgi:hypothetical protein
LCVSAISYIHKILGIFDPTSAFVVKKLLKGCNNLRKSHDTRLPITKQILEKINLSKIKSKFHECLYDFLADHDREDLNKVIAELFKLSAGVLVFRWGQIQPRSNLSGLLIHYYFSRLRN